MKKKTVSTIKYSDYHDKKLFLKAVSEYCVQSLSNKQKADMRYGRNAYFYNLTLGERIRNDFLYPQERMIEREIKKRKENGEDWTALLIDAVTAKDLAENAHEYSMDVLLMVIGSLVRE